MKLDLHVHTKYSQDATGEIKEIIKKSKKIGLDGLAITDHNEIKGSLEALEYKSENFIVIPGIEISSSQGHLLGLGIKEIIPKGLIVEETLEKIITLGGIAIVAHPYRRNSKIRKFERFNAVEVFNSRCRNYQNEKAEKIATELKLGRTAGSDCHSIFELGCGITEFATQNSNYENLIEDLVKGRASCYGKSTPKLRILKQACNNFKLWLERGGKRI